jgi:hypothetical protein
LLGVRWQRRGLGGAQRGSWQVMGEAALYKNTSRCRCGLHIKGAVLAVQWRSGSGHGGHGE